MCLPFKKTPKPPALSHCLIKTMVAKAAIMEQSGSTRPLIIVSGGMWRLRQKNGKPEQVGAPPLERALRLAAKHEGFTVARVSEASSLRGLVTSSLTPLRSHATLPTIAVLLHAEYASRSCVEHSSGFMAHRSVHT